MQTNIVKTLSQYSPAEIERALCDQIEASLQQPADLISGKWSTAHIESWRKLLQVSPVVDQARRARLRELIALAHYNAKLVAKLQQTKARTPQRSPVLILNLHVCPAPYQLLEAVWPQLKARGYNTVLLEKGRDFGDADHAGLAADALLFESKLLAQQFSQYGMLLPKTAPTTPLQQAWAQALAKGQFPGYEKFAPEAEIMLPSGAKTRVNEVAYELQVACVSLFYRSPLYKKLLQDKVKFVNFDPRVVDRTQIHRSEVADRLANLGFALNLALVAKRGEGGIGMVGVGHGAQIAKLYHTYFPTLPPLKVYYPKHTAVQDRLPMFVRCTMALRRQADAAVAMEITAIPGLVQLEMSQAPAAAVAVFKASLNGGNAKPLHPNRTISRGVF